MELVIEELRFRSSSGQCAATLTPPDRVTRPPLLVLGHGVGAARETGLQRRCVDRFAQAGIDSLAFTYPVRHFDFYAGPTFEPVVTDQMAFLQRHLEVSA
jgi:hypothetical protein